MRMKERIEAALQGLAPLLLQVDDRSAEHHGHSGWREAGETHFDVRVVSASFRGQTRIARHRAVNELLAPLLVERIHALSLRTSTPEEAEAEPGSAAPLPEAGRGRTATTL